jgi:hypothetical protein
MLQGLAPDRVFAIGTASKSPAPQGAMAAGAPPQLVLGFGNVSERAVESGIAQVADLLR